MCDIFMSCNNSNPTEAEICYHNVNMMYLSYLVSKYVIILIREAKNMHIFLQVCIYSNLQQ